MKSSFRAVNHFPSQINSQSIQDMHLFGDPSRIPVIIVERVMNGPLRTTSGNSYFSSVNKKDTSGMVTELKSVNKLSGASPQQSGRVLKIVVFVHGFQVGYSVFLAFEL